MKKFTWKFRQFEVLSDLFVNPFNALKSSNWFNIHSIFLGIATEIIKARIPMMKYLNLKVTSTGFSSVGAQIAAKRAGCKIDFDIRWWRQSLFYLFNSHLC